jgi:hypothetical protein
MSTTSVTHNGQTDDSPQRQAEMMDQRWPMSVEMRAQIINMALELAGLKRTGPDTVQPIAGPKPRPRIRLAAMRLLASYDRLSIQERKIDLLENPSGERPAPEDDDPPHEISGEVAEKCLTLLNQATFRREQEPPQPPKPKPKPVIPPRPIRQRWPISQAIREQLIREAFGLCGFTVTRQGQLEPIPSIGGTPRRGSKIVLAALRILASFDRLSLEERRVELRFVPPEPRHGSMYGTDPETAAKVHALFEADRAGLKPGMPEWPQWAEPVPDQWWRGPLPEGWERSADSRIPRRVGTAHQAP